MSCLMQKLLAILLEPFHINYDLQDILKITVIDSLKITMKKQILIFQ
jgi:hypothetical protein